MKELLSDLCSERFFINTRGVSGPDSQCDLKFCVVSALGLHGISFKIPSHNSSGILGGRKVSALTSTVLAELIKIKNKIVNQITLTCFVHLNPLCEENIFRNRVN